MRLKRKKKKNVFTVLEELDVQKGSRENWQR